MKVIFVHGRSQHGKNPVAIKKEWTDALTYGLARGNAQIPTGTAFVLPYYGDELAKLVAEVEKDLPTDIALRGSDTADYGLGQAQREILAELATAAGVTSDEVARQAGTLGARDPQNWGWVLAALRSLSKIPGLDARMIEAFTRDVAVYLTYEPVQRRIDALVIDSLGTEPFVIVAHSLGTVVAYNALRKVERTARCTALITLGSPLGISGITRRLTTPLTWPAGLPSWFNAYDKADVVSLYPLDAAHFNVDPPIINYGEVKNFTDNRHGIAGYLADPVVAVRIADALIDSGS